MNENNVRISLVIFNGDFTKERIDNLLNIKGILPQRPGKICWISEWYFSPEIKLIEPEITEVLDKLIKLKSQINSIPNSKQFRIGGTFCGLGSCGMHIKSEDIQKIAELNLSFDHDLYDLGD